MRVHASMRMKQALKDLESAKTKLDSARNFQEYEFYQSEIKKLEGVYKANYAVWEKLDKIDFPGRQTKIKGYDY